MSDDEYEGLSAILAAACRKADQAARSRATPAATPSRDILARSTIDATIFVIQQKDPERLRRWLRVHTPEEREAMKALILSWKNQNAEVA
jgi:hypothetical protein